MNDKKSPYEEISVKLKRYYDSVRDEEIPDRFLDLLERLSDAEEQASRSAKNQADIGKKH